MASNSSDTMERTYKVIVVGNRFVGKTCLIRRYVHHYYSEAYKVTMGVDFAMKTINWDNETVIKLQIWDIFGQDNIEKLSKVFFKNAAGALILYDVNNPITFSKARNWKEEIDDVAFQPNGSNIPVILLANKCDLEKIGDHNDPSYLDNYIKEKGYLSWFETSSKQDINIDQAMRCLVNQMYESDCAVENEDQDKDYQIIDVNATQKETPQSKSCCFK